MNEAEVYLKKLNYLESRIAFLERLERGFVEERGWIPIFQTAIYASPTSVTFANVDLTAYLKIGVKCSWYQSAGWRYGYVLSSSYSVGNTTLNFVANTSFNVANTAISTFKISYGNPPDFPRTFTYTPTITAASGTFTSVSATGTFRIDGHAIYIEIVINITTNGSAGIVVIATMPMTAIGDFMFVGRNANTGNMLQGLTQNSNTLGILNYNNTYAGGDSNVLFINGMMLV